MRSGEPQRLTAGAVTSAAGIARNSIYRYVDSVDDLRGLVLARHLPAWIDAVAAELGAVDDPAERIVVWGRANLQQAAPAKVMDDSQAVMRDAIAQAWAALVKDPTQLRIAAGLTRGLLEAGFRQLDTGMPVDVVVDLGEKAARGLVAGITGGDR